MLEMPLSTEKHICLLLHSFGLSLPLGAQDAFWTVHVPTGGVLVKTDRLVTLSFIWKSASGSVDLRGVGVRSWAEL